MFSNLTKETNTNYKASPQSQSNAVTLDMVSVGRVVKIISGPIHFKGVDVNESTLFLVSNKTLFGWSITLNVSGMSRVFVVSKKLASTVSVEIV